MSHHDSPKTQLRLGSLATALWLAAISSAFAQDAPDITLKFSPAQVAEIGRLIDLQPMSKDPPKTDYAAICDAIRAHGRNEPGADRVRAH
jgi:hypothetical protein